MRDIFHFLGIEAPVLKLFSFGLVGVGFVEAVRLIRLARCLYCFSFASARMKPSIEGLDPEAFARHAAANQPPPTTLAGRHKISRASQSNFQLRLTLCRNDIDSAKRAVRLIILIALAGISCGAYPTLMSNFNDTNTPLDGALLLTARPLLAVLSIALTLSSLLYFSVSLFEKRLQDCKAAWDHFIASSNIPDEPE